MQTDRIISSITTCWVFGSLQCSRTLCHMKIKQLYNQIHILASSNHFRVHEKDSYDKFCLTMCNSNSHLYDTTTIRMGGQCHNLIIKYWHDELNCIFRDAFDTLLNNMISILISYTAHDVAIKFCNHFSLLVQINNFNGLGIYKQRYKRNRKTVDELKPKQKFKHKKCFPENTA